MPAVRKYPPDLMDSAVRMVLHIRRQDPQRPGIVGMVGDLMGIHPEVLRHWVRKAEPEPAPAADAAVPAAAASAATAVAAAERPVGEPIVERIECLERENADLRRANQVLKAAAVLFASELQHAAVG